MSRLVGGGVAYSAEPAVVDEVTGEGGAASSHNPIFEHLDGVAYGDDGNLQAAGITTLQQLVAKDPFYLMSILGWSGHGLKVVKMITHARTSIPGSVSVWNMRNRDPHGPDHPEPDQPDYPGQFWFNSLTQTFFWLDINLGTWREVA